MSFRDLIVQKLEASGAWYNETPGNDWIQVHCQHPEHQDSKPSAGINIHSGIHHCFSDGHTFKFITEDTQNADVLWDAKYKYLKSTIEKQKEEVVEDITFPIPPKKFDLFEEWRGVSAELLQELGAYYCDRGRFTGRFVFPVYQDGKYLGFDARIYDSSAQFQDVKWLRAKHMPVKDIIYPSEVLKRRFKNLEHVVVTEGVMDAISYIQMGVPAFPSFGVTPPSMKRIEGLIRLGVKKVTLGYDNDIKGVQGIIRVAPLYAEWFEIVQHPLTNMINASSYKDANEFLVGVKNKGLQTKKEYDSGDL